MEQEESSESQLDVGELFARRYGAYLFFDIELGQDPEFTRLAVEIASADNFLSCSFDVHSAQTGKKLGEFQAGGDSTSILSSMQSTVESGEITLGLLLAEKQRTWFISQASPVALGIIGLSKENLAKAPASVLEDYFVTCSELSKWDAEKIRGFDLSYGANSHSRILQKFCR